MALIEPAAKAVGPRGATPMPEYLDRLEHASVLTTIDNLMTFPCVKILAERGKLQLHAAYFGVAAGTLSVLDRESGKFVRVAADEHAEIFNAPRF
jgi:carbonic anhydrase